MIRIAAVADIHYDSVRRFPLKAQFEALSTNADLFLIAGDLTQSGLVEEARALATDLSHAKIPTVVVLGNHDYHRNQEGEIHKVLKDVGVTVLEGNSIKLKVQGHDIGIAGLKGFGGGFFGACVTEFGEREMKAFAHHSRSQAELLKKTLENLDTEYRFALLHFSPVESTLLGERREIYPFLGSYLLAEAIDSVGVDAAFHGHAHFGTEKGYTSGGVPVRNVAQTVIRHTYNVYSFEKPWRELSKRELAKDKGLS